MTQLNKIRTQRFVVSGEVSQRLTVTRQTVDFWDESGTLTAVIQAWERYWSLAVSTTKPPKSSSWPSLTFWSNRQMELVCLIFCFPCHLISFVLAWHEIYTPFCLELGRQPPHLPTHMPLPWGILKVHSTIEQPTLNPYLSQSDLSQSSCTFVKLQLRQQATNLYGNWWRWGIWQTLWNKLGNSEPVVIPRNWRHSVGQPSTLVLNV